MERHIFFMRDQKQGESVDGYITDWKAKAAICEFGTLCDSLVRDRFISGVLSENLTGLLFKEKDLTLGLPQSSQSWMK